MFNDVVKVNDEAKEARKLFIVSFMTWEKFVDDDWEVVAS